MSSEDDHNASSVRAGKRRAMRTIPSENQETGVFRPFSTRLTIKRFKIFTCGARVGIFDLKRFSCWARNAAHGGVKMPTTKGPRQASRGADRLTTETLEITTCLRNELKRSEMPTIKGKRQANRQAERFTTDTLEIVTSLREYLTMSEMPTTKGARQASRRAERFTAETLKMATGLRDELTMSEIAFVLSVH